MESSGTACGLNWHIDDQSHRSLFITLPVMAILMFVLSLWSIRKAFSINTPEKMDDKDWFTNYQLNWVCTYDVCMSCMSNTSMSYDFNLTCKAGNRYCSYESSHDPYM